MIIDGARQLATQHLSIRVPWHDSGWNGSVCRNPLGNTSCLVLKNIGECRDDAREAGCAGKRLDQLPVKDWPPCVEERATFLAPFEITRTIEHVYAKGSPGTHGHLLPTKYRQPPFSAPAIPFDWLRRARVEGENGEPGLAFAEVDLGRIAESRGRVPALQHRRAMPPVEIVSA